MSKEYFEAQSKVFVFGDIMSDEYIYSDVDRISPEASVPVFKFQSNEYRLSAAVYLAVNTGALRMAIQ